MTLHPVDFSNPLIQLTLGSVPPHSAYPPGASTLTSPSPGPIEASGDRAGPGAGADGGDGVAELAAGAAREPARVSPAPGPPVAPQAAASNPATATATPRRMLPTRSTPLMNADATSLPGGGTPRRPVAARASPEGHEFVGKPRFTPPWEGSSQREVTTLPRV
ncbi:hypothetical protein TBS_00070 [Thermobispora bispora]